MHRRTCKIIKTYNVRMLLVLRFLSRQEKTQSSEHKSIASKHTFILRIQYDLSTEHDY